MNWRPDAFAGNPFERLIKLTHGSMPNNAQPSCSSFPVDIALYRLVGSYNRFTWLVRFRIYLPMPFAFSNLVMASSISCINAICFSKKPMR